MPPYDQPTDIIRGTRQNRIIWEQGPTADELQVWKASERQHLARLHQTMAEYCKGESTYFGKKE